MRTKKVDVKDKNLLVVGPLYNKLEKLYAIEPLVKDNSIVVLLGDICFPYEKYSDVPSRIEQMKLFMEGKDAHYVLGDKDLVYMQKTFAAHADTHDWLAVQPLAVRFVFENQTSALVVHGGILPRHTTWGEISDDLEISFITNVPTINKPWHRVYNGRFGYVLSSHPATKENEAVKYEHSISLDTNAHETDKVAVQEFTEKGLGETFYI